MPIALLLIVLGIILAVLVSSVIGILCVVVGLVLLIWPAVTNGGTRL